MTTTNDNNIQYHQCLYCEKEFENLSDVKLGHRMLRGGVDFTYPLCKNCYELDVYREVPSK